MGEEKLDAELMLALETSALERKRSLDLNVGYDSQEQTWELIVKYFGDLNMVRNELGATVTELLNGYAIIWVRENLIGRLASYPQIEFIEKPKNLILSEIEGMSVSCVNFIRLPPYELYGESVIIAIIDSGIDYSHPDFRDENGRTRILALWDQSAYSESNFGVIYSREQIDEALLSNNKMDQLQIVPENDLSGHGTHVAGIACGNGRASNGRYVGVAPRADLLVVKLGPASEQGFPRTSELMQAIDWCVRYAQTRNAPLALNISFGNNYGDHMGASLLERYIDSVAKNGKLVICVGAGNEGNTGRHLAGRVNSNTEQVEVAVAPYETGLNIQIWKEYADRIRVTVESPSGIRAVAEEGRAISVGQDTDIRIIYALPTPYNARQEIYIALIPKTNYIESGIWKINLEPIYIRSGVYNMWLPVAGATSSYTGFLRPTLDLSITIPGTAYRAITVGAYDSRTDGYASFSGRGYGVEAQKPNIVAPGVGITAAAPGGGYDVRTGTSMATPFVTGAAALLMEWGIINGNDPYLYGERLRAALIRGSRVLPGYISYPNNQVGWGALCVRDSIRFGMFDTDL